MLQIKNLTKSFDGRTNIVENLSLTVDDRQVFGFLGPNGAGKTTTAKLIVGLLFPDRGSIRLGNLPTSSLEAKRIIGFMPENPQFYNHLNAREVLEFIGNLFGFNQSKIKQRVSELLQLVGLEEIKSLATKKFSKGMHQRLAFAVALFNEPQLLILDEPLDGLDPLGRLDFKRLLLTLKKTGTTTFLSSHILADVEELCDEVAIVRGGKILRQGLPRQLIGKSYKTLEEMFVATVRR